MYTITKFHGRRFKRSAKRKVHYQLLHRATENARPDIARLDNSAPYRKGGLVRSRDFSTPCYIYSQLYCCTSANQRSVHLNDRHSTVDEYWQHAVL